MGLSGNGQIKGGRASKEVLRHGPHVFPASARRFLHSTRSTTASVTLPARASKKSNGPTTGGSEDVSTPRVRKFQLLDGFADDGVDMRQQRAARHSMLTLRLPHRLAFRDRPGYIAAPV